MISASRRGRCRAAAGGRPCSARPGSSCSCPRIGPFKPIVNVAVALVVGVEGHADGEAVDLEQHLGLGCGRVLVVMDGEQAARPGPDIEVLEDEQAVGPRLGGQDQGLLEVSLGKARTTL